MIEPTYFSNHGRLKYQRGSASAHPCVDCGKPARDWSQRHDTDPTDVMSYEPRCRADHMRYDGKHEHHSEVMRGRKHPVDCRHCEAVRA